MGNPGLNPFVGGASPTAFHRTEYLRPGKWDGSNEA